MNDNRTTLEVIAPSVDEALAQGLSELGLTENDIDVEVLDEGSRGLFGIGSRQARIRITVKSFVEEEPNLPGAEQEISDGSYDEEAPPPQTAPRAPTE